MVKKIVIIMTITILLFSVGSGCFALDLQSASLVQIGSAEQHLQYYREDRGYSTPVVCSIVGYYNESGTFLPAYCMNKELPGAETTEYTVDINSLVDNDAVWRVVKNGYPYKSAEAMGLSSDFDAYAVTKFAIYCVLGQSTLSNFSALDSTGTQMMSVLTNLVDIGFNGTETRNSGTMSVSKVDEFLSDGEYYYQEYQVSSTVNMSEYTVSISSFPDGTYVADTDNNAKSTFSSGENFRVLIPTVNINSDINGTIKMTGKCETYPVFYGEAPSGYQNYAVTYSTYGSESISISLQVTTNTGSLKIIKVDDETEVPIEGVSFTLKSEDESYEVEGTTDSNGELYFSDLYQGKYILIETATNEKYVLDEENQYTVDIIYNEASEITINNSIKKGKVKIIKIDFDTGEALEGVEFNIMDSDTGEILETLITDENGEAESSYLRVDRNYSLQETKTLENYILNEEVIYFNVSEDEVLEIKITNQKQPEEVKVLPKTGL